MSIEQCSMSSVYFVCAYYYTLLNGEWDRVPVTQVLCFAAQHKIKVQLSQALNKTQRETLGTAKQNTERKESTARLCRLHEHSEVASQVQSLP